MNTKIDKISKNSNWTKPNMSNPFPEVTLTYEGTNITFLRGDSVMVNATQMAKAFGKKPAEWIRLPSTVEFVKTLEAMGKSHSSELIKAVNGVGTWMHEDVALEFARWLSPAFAIWTNDHIKNLMTTGVTTVSNDDEAILHAISVLQKRIDSFKQRTQILESENEIQKEEIKVLAPKAEYTDEVLQSTSTFTTTQIAKDFGLSAKTLNKKLKEAGIQFFQSGQWFLYSKYQDKDYTDMRVSRYVNRHTGNVETQQSMVWTEKGRAFLHQLRKGGKL